MLSAGALEHDVYFIASGLLVAVWAYLLVLCVFNCELMGRNLLLALGVESSKGHGVEFSTDVEVGGDFVQISVEGRSVYHEVRLGTACGFWLVFFCFFPALSAGLAGTARPLNNFI